MITYPITLPFSTRGARRIAIKPEVVASAEVSPFSLIENMQVGTGQRWSAQIDLPAMKRTTGAPEWLAALVSLNGPQGTFYLGDTANKAPRGVATGTPLVNGAGQTGYDLNTKGWTAGVTNIMRAGDWVQVGTLSNARLHMVMKDANSDGSGNATLTLWPKLRYSPADNLALTVNSAVGVFRLASAISWDIDHTKLVQGLSFSAVEALNP